MHHMAVHKSALIKWVWLYGPRILEPEPASVGEALRILEADPREWISGCPDPLPSGKCPGHDVGLDADDLPGLGLEVAR